MASTGALGFWRRGPASPLALPIGWVQERGERSAGVRTFPPVAVASCGLVLVGLESLGEDAGRRRGCRTG